MAKLPQIVRTRLKAAQLPLQHPDADMLTAFSERALPDRERDLVLEHLGRCRECREVICLALPEFELPAQEAAASSWTLSWPALRWGFAAAGVLVIVALGVRQ